ncbi:MAG: hypothetical protein NC115_05160 [Bacteroidales bacterium]|nr:hypothetical protein [Bacteroidales bacterium]
MIQATGNNFGCGAIEIKDYQCEKLIVLNTKFSFSNKSDEFKAADVLEIYIPDLTLNKSGISGGFVMATIEPNYFGTTVKTWIKNRNTICIEKIDAWSEESDEHTIYLLSLYVPKGQRKAFETGTKKYTPVTFENSENYISSPVSYIDEHWCMLAIQFSSYNSPSTGLEEILHIENFPTDVDIELPFVSDNINCRYPGSDMRPARLSAGSINAGLMPFGWGGMPRDHFFYAICVRDGESSTKTEETETTETTE